MRDPRPAKRKYQTQILDSTRWDDFKPRIGDIVVNTPPKTGTTWTQSILALLISGDPKVDPKTATKSPWIEFCPDAMAEMLAEAMTAFDAQTDRRHVKSHTAFDGIPVWPDLRYITVYRHPVDIFFSLRKHANNMNMELDSKALADDVQTAFRAFVDNEDLGNTSVITVVNHYKCTLALEPAENLIRLHYADMTRDLSGAFAQIGAHVGISHPSPLLEQLIAAASFKNMKANADRFTPGADLGVWKSNSGFFDSGTSNKWEGVLDANDMQAYEARISKLLTPSERYWLEWGKP